MQESYWAFVAAAYGMAALALGGLGVWTFWDARSVSRRLKAMEAKGAKRRGSSS